jgi:uncharacterized protein (DUF2267 family)
MKSFSERQIIERLMETGPFTDEQEARRALAATPAVRGSALTSDERAFVGAELPAELAGVLQAALNHPRVDWHGFNQRIARAEGVRLGLAIERARHRGSHRPISGSR